MNSTISVLRDGLNIGQKGSNIISQQMATQESLGTRKELYLTTDTLGNPVSKGVINAVNEGTVLLLQTSSGKDGSDAVQGAALENISNIVTDKDGNNLAVLWGEISGTLDKLTVGSATSNMVSSALDQFCLKLNDSERTLQTYRQQADRSIASNVERVNAILKEIHTLNKNLERLKTDTLTMQEATLQDQRRTLLVELHSYMNVQTSETATSVTIATPNGLLLLDESVHPLTFSQFPTTIDASVLAGSGLNGIETDTGFDISHLITSGKIHGNLQIRDVTGPKYSDKLSEITQAIYTEVNKNFNKGTPFPPPTTLTGITAYEETDSVTITGSVYVTVLDAAGNYVGRVAFSDETLTLADLRDRISAHADMTATLASGGNPLVITGNNNRHVAIGGTGTIQIDGQPETSTNFSHFFGFHNAFKFPNYITTSTKGLGAHIQVNDAFVKGNIPLGTLDTTVTTGNVISQNKMDVALAVLKELGNQGTILALNPSSGEKNLKNHLLDFMVELVNETKNCVSDAKHAKEVYHQTQQMFQGESGINVEDLVMEAQKWFDYINQLAKMLQGTHESNMRLIDAIGHALTRG